VHLLPSLVTLIKKLTRKCIVVRLRASCLNFRQDRLVVVEKFGVDTPKTKALVAKLNDLELNDVLIVTPEVEENLFLAARNLYKVDVRDVAGIDPVSLIAFEKVLITADAVKQLEEALA